MTGPTKRKKRSPKKRWSPASPTPVNAGIRIKGHPDPCEAEKLGMQASYRFLEIADQHQEMRPLLRAYAVEIQKITGCSAVGIRLIEKHGLIPYQVAIGLDRELHEPNNFQCIETDPCLCVNIIQNRAGPGLDLSSGGSFHRNQLSTFLASLPAFESRSIGNTCPFFGFESLALIPIRMGKKSLGLIHVADRQPDLIATRMVKLLEYTAMQLGTGVQRIMSQEKIWKLYARLEDQVQERTLALTRTNEQLRQEIDERNRAREALKDSEKKLRFLTSQLLNAQEKERKRISSELHDELGQALLTLKLQLRALENRLRDDQVDLRNDFQLIFKHINSVTDNVRRLSRDLSPSILEDLGLVAALRWLAKRLGKHYYIDIICDIDDLQECFNPEKELILFRIFQEALTNVVKHARSRWARITAAKYDRRFELIIEDRGRGFDVDQVLTLSADERGLGLTAMDERVRMVGGQLEVRSKAGAGTVLTITVPIAMGHGERGEGNGTLPPHSGR